MQGVMRPISESGLSTVAENTVNKPFTAKINDYWEFSGAKTRGTGLQRHRPECLSPAVSASSGKASPWINISCSEWSPLSYCKTFLFSFPPGWQRSGLKVTRHHCGLWWAWKWRELCDSPVAKFWIDMLDRFLHCRHPNAIKCSKDGSTAFWEPSCFVSLLICLYIFKHIFPRGCDAGMYQVILCGRCCHELAEPLC